MYQVMDLSGAVLHSEREYDIAVDTVINPGQLVKLTDGLVVAAAAGETGAVLGVAGENHHGAEDPLNPRANGKRIIVQDAPSAVFASPAPVLTALSGGNATTVKFTGADGVGADAFKGGYIKDKTGHVRRITGSTDSSGSIDLTVESGETVAEGDTFVLFPPVGFRKANLSSDGTKLIVTATAELPIQVVGRDEQKNEIWTAAVLHQLGPVTA